MPLTKELLASDHFPLLISNRNPIRSPRILKPGHLPQQINLQHRISNPHQLPTMSHQLLEH